jgi:hypothetical protein
MDRDGEISIQEFTNYMHFLEPNKFSAVQISTMFYDLLTNYADEDELTQLHVVDFCIHSGIYCPHDDRAPTCDSHGKSRSQHIAEIDHMKGLFGAKIAAGGYRGDDEIAPLWKELVAHEPGAHSSFAQVIEMHEKMNKCMIRFLVQAMDKDGDGSLSAEELSHLGD